HLEERLTMVVRELRTLDADVVGVQEASRGRRRGDVAARLASDLGFHHVYAPAAPRWPPVSRVLGLEEGPALLSRFPIVTSHVHPIDRCGGLYRPPAPLRPPAPPPGPPDARPPPPARAWSRAASSSTSRAARRAGCSGHQTTTGCCPRWRFSGARVMGRRGAVGCERRLVVSPSRSRVPYTAGRPAGRGRRKPTVWRSSLRRASMALTPGTWCAGSAMSVRSRLSMMYPRRASRSVSDRAGPAQQLRNCLCDAPV